MTPLSDVPTAPGCPLALSVGWTYRLIRNEQNMVEVITTKSLASAWVFCLSVSVPLTIGSM